MDRYNNQCECPLCKRGRKFEEVIKKYKMNEEDKSFLEGIMCALDHEENDAEYYKLILDGKWPQSLWILRRATRRAFKIWKEKYA